MTVLKHRLWIAGSWMDSPDTREVFSPFDGGTVAETAQASSERMEQALAATAEAFRVYRKISAYTRSRLLAGIAQQVAARRKDFVERIVAEAGKPASLADTEVSRAVNTFALGAEETKRLGGELIPVDLDAAGRAYGPAFSRWVPRGPVLAIAPFNFPLNLIAHKVSPALAAGATVVIKPPPQAPGAAGLLAEIFEKTAREVSDARDAIPLAALQVVSADNEIIAKALADPRIQTLSFTGSDKVGWMLQQKAVGKKICLELGGNAAVIVHRDADLARAAARCAFGGYAYAGQICISVQRVFVHDDVAKQFEKLFLDEIGKLKVGDPSQTGVTVGPLIDSAAADRVQAWAEEAKRDGARAILPGERNGNVITPMVIAGAKPQHKISSEEVFGPVVTLDRYRDFDDALNAVNRSRFGLQAGVFAESAEAIRRAGDELDVGGVIVNEVPTYRADNMPYGGMKDSGLGREGVRYAMEDFCERKTLVAWRG
ncbi:MAG: aldehyde dehydrogenase family protein [Deltaproteobacteria bacterium]|nr:aldehyde dehydrogenase family protein [Deltaproteobacteria bacterium]